MVTAVTDPLDALDESPESKIVKAFFALIRNDAKLAAAFQPILLVETITREQFKNVGAWTMTVSPMAATPLRLRPQEHPSRRETVFVPIMVSSFLPPEQSTQDSKLHGLDIGNHIRKIINANQGIADTFENASYAPLTPLYVDETGVRVLSGQATYEIDIDPETGDPQ